MKASTATQRTERSENPTSVPSVRPWSASGSFFISNNGIVPATEDESGALESVMNGVRRIAAVVGEFLLSSAHADQVILDDLVVDGSACVGQDCVNGEAFGFDTIRIKENNLRIGFTDTSNSASFPSNDWGITINDSSNGGANYFGVKDVTGGRRIFTLEASAPSNSLYVDSGGRIGLGTSNPVVELHMTDGDTPTLRLEQDGSSGFSPQTWDVAGNETNFFIRDASNGSTLPFRIRPGAPSSTIDISAKGNVGIGTSSPDATLHVRETDAAQEFLIKAETTTPAAEVFTVAGTGDTVILGNLDVGSSRTLKQNIQEVGGLEALEALDNLAPVHFSYRASPDVHSLGFIAEDVPDIVATKNRKTLRPMDLVALLTKVTQEQQKSIENLSEQVAALQMQAQLVSGIQE